MDSVESGVRGVFDLCRGAPGTLAQVVCCVLAREREHRSQQRTRIYMYMYIIYICVYMIKPYI
jgi:hypothetical protein